MSLFNPYKETRLDISLTSVGAALMIAGLILALICGQLALRGLPADAVSLKRSPSEIKRDGTIVPREQIHTEVFRRAFGYARVAHLGGGIMLFGAALVAIGHGGRLYRLVALGVSAAALAVTLPATVKLSTLAVRYSEPPPLVVQSPVEVRAVPHDRLPPDVLQPAGKPRRAARHLQRPPRRQAAPRNLQLSRDSGWFMSLNNVRIVGGNEVEFELDPSGRTDLTLTLRAGAPGASGPLGRPAADPLAVTLEARMLVGAAQVINGLDQPLISVRLSNPADLEKAPGSSPSIRPCPSPSNPVPITGTAICRRLRGEFVPGQTYKLRLLKGLPGEWIHLDKEVTQTVLIPDYTPQLNFADSGRYLSTRGRRTLKLEGVNITHALVTVRQVYDNNLLYFAMRESDRYVRDYGSHVRGLMGPASTLKLAPKLARNKPGAFPLDLSGVITNGLRGVYWVSVSSTDEEREPDEYSEYSESGDGASLAARLVVVSDLGLSVKKTPSGLLVWVTSLSTGNAVTGVTVRAYSVSNQELGDAVTGPDGIVQIPLDPKADATAEAYVITAAAPGDLTFLAMETTRVDIPGGQDGDPLLRKGYEAFLYSDRGVYRPGETAHIRAIVRDSRRGAPEPFPLELRVIRPDGREAAKAPSKTSPLGATGFDHRFDPAGPVGAYSVQAFVPGGKEPIGSLSLQHEEFVPPQIVVKMPLDTARVSTGEVFQVTTTASHLFGSPAAGLALRQTLSIKPAPFAPAGWEDHVFGDPQRNFSNIYTDPEEGELDENGGSVIEREVKVGNLPPASLVAILVSTVIDGTGRPASAFGRKPVDPVPFYIGVKAGEGNWVAGRPRAVDLAAVSPAGVVTNAGPLSARLEKVLWNTVLERGDNGGYTYVSKATREKVWTRDVALTGGRAKFEFDVATAGSYELSVTAPSGAATRISLYVSNGTAGWQDVNVAKAGQVEVSADVAEAAPGQVVKITGKAPFRGLALVTLESDVIITNAVVTMTGNAFEIPLRIPDTHDSTVYAVVSVVRALQAGDLPGTHRATGLLAIPVHRASEKAAAVIEAPELIRPQTDLVVKVRSPELAGQTAEVTIAAVDEAICMLTDFKTPDILAWLNRPRALAVALFDAFNYLLPEATDELLGRGAKVGGDGDMGLGSRLNPVDARRFRPVALWSGTLLLGPDGTAATTLKVPEFTGKLRVMAVVCGARGMPAPRSPCWCAARSSSSPPFRASPRRATVSTPACASTTSPRAPVNAKWTVSVTGAASLAGAAAGAADLARDAQQNLRIPLVAAATSGVARVTFAAGEGDLRYEETLDLAVRPARSSVVESGAFAVPPGETRSFDWPAGFALPSVRDRLCVAGLPSLSFSGGLEYLFRYPYGCLEQTTSTSFPLLYLVDLAELTDPRGRSREENAARIQSGIARVLSMQLSDGWLALWPSSRDAYPYGSIYAAHFLTEAARAGYEVPQAPFKDLLKAINSSLSSWNDGGATANGFNDQEIAYALYVLALNGQWNEGWSARLEEKKDNLAVSARILNAAAKAVSGRREEAAKMLQAVSPSALAATTPRKLGGSLNSPVQDLSLLLSAWLEVDPANAAVPDLARRLEATQKGGNGWYTTHDNALALMALGKFAARVAADQKAFEADIVIGPAKHAASTAKALSLKPDAALDKVVITNRGPGTAYVSWMRAGIPSAGVEPDNATGLKVTREWLDSTGKPRDPATFRQGDLAVVKVTVDSLGREVDQVAVEDLLPAGLEVENPVFKTSSSLPWLGELMKGPLLHVEHRDDRVLAFSGAFNGQLVFGYQVRAVTPGEFVLPAVSAECMYDPSLRAAKGASRIKAEALK
ncbi:MAG: MG2 domain-containing protein [Kiritimatiellia bacterium]